MLKFQTALWWNFTGGHGGARTDMDPADGPFHRMAAKLVFGEVAKIEATSAPPAGAAAAPKAQSPAAVGLTDVGQLTQQFDLSLSLNQASSWMMARILENQVENTRMLLEAQEKRLLRLQPTLQDSPAARIAALRQESARRRQGAGPRSSAAAGAALPVLAEQPATRAPPGPPDGA